MNTLPAEGFVREKQLIGDKSANPPIPGILPFGHTTLWNKTKAGEFPKPVKLGPNITAWPVEAVRRYIEEISNAA